MIDSDIGYVPEASLQYGDLVALAFTQPIGRDWHVLGRIVGLDALGIRVNSVESDVRLGLDVYVPWSNVRGALSSRAADEKPFAKAAHEWVARMAQGRGKR